jgi:hypothetical protein
MIIFHNILQCDHLVILCFEMAVGHFYARHRKQLFVVINNYTHEEEATRQASSHSVESNHDDNNRVINFTATGTKEETKVPSSQLSMGYPSVATA